MAGISLGIAAWALITGVTMVKSGLPVPLALLMSLLVYAGTAQLAALPLMASGAPIWVVWATALCLNLRFVIFSAQWRPYFADLPRFERARMAYFTADLNYVVFMRRFPEPKPAPEQRPYFWGGTVTNWLSWQLPSIAGIFLGDRMHRIRRHGGAARADVFAARRPRLVDCRRSGRLRGGGSLRIAAEAEHRRRHRRGGGGRAADGPHHAAPRRTPGRRDMMSTWEAITTICGLACITMLTRGFFILPEREIPLPGWLRQGLRYAPLAAMAAVVVPEVVMSGGHLITTWRDARLYAAAAGAAYFFWRRGILGTIVVGTGTMLALRLGLNW